LKVINKNNLNQILIYTKDKRVTLPRVTLYFLIIYYNKDTYKHF